MSVFYEKENLLSVFDSVRIIDKHAEVIEYTLLNEFKQRLDLYISTYDEYATVTFMREDEKSWFFDVGIKNLEKIIYEEDTLKFYKNDNAENPALTVKMKPGISLWCRAETPRKSKTD